METVKIYSWMSLRQLIIDGMVEWLKTPTLRHRAYIMKGIPKFPDGNCDDKYLHEYIIWLVSNTSIIDQLISDTCFIIQHKNHKIFFDLNEIVYSCNFAESIP